AGGAAPTTGPSRAAPPPGDRLDEFAANIRSGGPPKDGIPPIEEPAFVAADEADFLVDDDVVFGIVHEGEVRAYPQLVLVWHEIVNDAFPDGPLSVTYCPLTGSTVGFRGTAPGGEPFTFGTSGNLVNSNLLMYDRQTDSQWPQILATAIDGPARGTELVEVPLDWTTWGSWRQRHPRTQVLSTDTGAIRDYGRDPYGSYRPLGGYYEPDSGLFFPVMHEDDRLPPKEVVIGVKRRDARLAVRKETVRDESVVATRLGDDSVVVVHDPAHDEGRAFLGRHSGKDVRLSPTGDGATYRDEATGTVFDAAGEPLSGSGTRPLERLVSYDVMWFAWLAFFPDSEVVL
ncbi:MAG: DUF3179 domain-containing protein, partial [Nitriliruptorales bacterium]